MKNNNDQNLWPSVPTLSTDSVARKETGYWHTHVQYSRHILQYSEKNTLLVKMSLPREMAEDRLGLSREEQQRGKGLAFKN